MVIRYKGEQGFAYLMALFTIALAGRPLHWPVISGRLNDKEKERRNCYLSESVSIGYCTIL